MELTDKGWAEYILELAGTDVRRCMQCGRCSAACPAAAKMDLPPHRMVWDLLCGHGEELIAAKAPWRCVSCMACEQRCPRGVSPAAVMEAARLASVRRQGGSRLTAESLEHYPDDMPQQALVAAFRKYTK